jgi:hypothetical protein
MAEETVDTSPPVDESPAPEAAPAIDSKVNPAPAAPTSKATVQNRPQRSSDAFDSIFEETKEELEKEDAPAPADVDDDDEEDEDDKPSTAPAKAKDADEDEDEDGEPKEDAPAEDSKELSVSEQILELLKNPDMLETALRQAGVETIQELPFFKDLVGRTTQSAVDSAKAAADKERFEETQINQVLEKGRVAATEVVNMVEKLRADLEEGAEEWQVPTSEYLVDQFNAYADGAVHAYHNKNFGEIVEVVYDYPEMKNLSDEQKTYLNQFAGKPPAKWLEAQYDVGRQNLWTMAQNDVRQQAEQVIADRTKVLEEAHKLDIQKLTDKHERQLAKATAKASDNARAEALADMAKNGTPPRTPSKGTPRTVVDDSDSGDDSFEGAWASAKRSLEKSGSV